MIRYILFDVDETLYPQTCAVWPMLRERILSYMVERVGMTRAEAEALRERYLKEYGTTTRGLHLHNGIDMDDYLEYVHDVPINAILFDDPELDQVLSQITMEKCLFTNATRRHALNVTDCLGISHHFSHIFSLEDFDFICKPEPYPYQVVLTTLGARAESCLLIEDSPRNLATAKQLGMKTVLVSTEATTQTDVVDFTISRVHEILDVVQRLNAASA